MYSEEFLNALGTCDEGDAEAERVANEYVETLAKHVASLEDIISIGDYKMLKDRIILRPLNKRLNEEKVSKCIHRQVGDIALTVYMVVLDDRENGILNTAPVPFEMLKVWKMKSDEVIDNALKNTIKKAEPRIYTNIFDIEHTPRRKSALLDKDFLWEGIKDGVNLLTTSRKTNGAIALFYPGVKEKLAELMQGNFYAAFTSIHEAMIHKEGSISVSSIYRNLKSTNEVFGDEETLTENVFFYNKETKEFEPVPVF